MRPRHPCCLIQKERGLASSAWRTMEAINLGNDDDDNYDDVNDDGDNNDDVNDDDDNYDNYDDDQPWEQIDVEKDDEKYVGEW